MALTSTSPRGSGLTPPAPRGVTPDGSSTAPNALDAWAHHSSTQSKWPGPPMMITMTMLDDDDDDDDDSDDDDDDDAGDDERW